jgi:protein-tyrosine phosphatase
VTAPDYTFITDRLAIGNVTARSIPGWIAIVTLLATKPWDEMSNAPHIPNLKVFRRNYDVASIDNPVCLHIDITDGESRRVRPDNGESYGHDLDEYLESATAFIARHIAHGCVLVHCGAGVSRSAAVVIAYLCRYAGMSYSEALGFVKAKRPQVGPADAFAIAIKNWLQLDKLAARGPR